MANTDAKSTNKLFAKIDVKIRASVSCITRPDAGKDFLDELMQRKTRMTTALEFNVWICVDPWGGIGVN